MAQMLVRPPEDLKDRLQIEAQRMGLTLNALVLQILWDWAKSKTVEATKAAQLPPRTEDQAET